jgi:hypothetical protein
MTLSVNGTIFCCRAVMMQDDGHEEVNSGNESMSDSLVLFSVIVAISAPVNLATVRFSTDRWFDRTAEDHQLEIQEYSKESSAIPDAMPAAQRRKQHKQNRGSVSAEFLSIRRVHISLARYCRVLEREERRCQYVSLQANQFSQIRNEQQKKWEVKKAASGVSNEGKNPSGGSTSSASVMASKSVPPTSERRSRGGRSASSFNGGDDLHLHAHQYDLTILEEQEKEQEILELMLAAPPPETSPDIPKHYGNLVRELVQVFHSLSRNDHIFPTTPASMLIERDGVVYVNQHIAIPVEAAGIKPSFGLGNTTVRPYYTLLFPHASPSELLHALQSSGSAPPQQIQQLLLTVNAQKPLTDIALDASLPLDTTLQMASYLVTHGACVMSPIVSRQARLTCSQVDRIPSLALVFTQLFGNVNMFRLIGFFTSFKTLGEAMTALTTLGNEDGAWLRETLLSGRNRSDHTNMMGYEVDEPNSKDPLGQGGRSQDLPGYWKEEMEEQLYAMAVWLISHRILEQLQDYFVVVGTEHHDFAQGRDSPATVPLSQAHSKADESLFRELLESDLLNGDISLSALSWRLGLDQNKVRSWGLRHRLIRVVSRIAKAGDDWES